ncbi:LOW QUALITY PROTEIN: probable disease resistance protein At4g27220 [Citrus clementina]|uniref:LOW QUALITY PROTEIN: probable disease resistance protein At4g27220 n=1 Tax=Citrus clementina TaxID=85681 RepID=UPI000CED04E0|nr:LOW QUALITY PROTEIN: probable disease resistance protein At4g27220 [Citrus x clementina]
MDILKELLKPLLERIGKCLANVIEEQASYLFCFDCIVRKLEDEKTKLKKALDDINKRIEDQRQKRPDIVVDQNVTEWLKNVDRELGDIRKLKEEIDEKDSSLHGLCPDWCCRYSLGGKTLEKTRKLFDLLQYYSQINTAALAKPPPLERELSLPSYFSSTYKTTESAYNLIIDALKKESTKKVGLHGLGGVGKTTLAKFVGSQLRQQKIFDKVGLATVSQHPNIINVQNELVNSLGWELKQKDEKDGADQLRSMFSASKSTKILIILDDVWNELNLKEKLGIPIGDRDNRCKILLTTRLQSVCERMRCDSQIPLGTLTPEEGLALLRKNAGIDVNDSTLNDVSKEVAGECNGLPLAIEAVGSALRGKGFDEWNLALHNLREAKLYAIEGIDKDERDVYGCLKFSYDNLNGEDSKLCFLLCSMFPEDYEINLEDLVGYVVGLTWYQAESIEHARSLLRGTIEGLKAASLLLDTGNDRSVKMHDIVRDVAIWISTEKKEKEERLFSINGIGLLEQAVEKGLEQCRGISVMGNKEEELPSSFICPNLHILRLDNTLCDYKLQVPENFFEGMPALKVVTIINGVLSLKSLRFLDNNLRVLQLIRCDVSDASFLGELKRLELLYLEDSPIEIPEDLSDELRRLKLLYIDTGSVSPITIKKLEEFYGRIKNWEVEGMSSEESNARLAELNSQADRSVVCLPKDFTFPKLQRYIIRKGEGVDDVMEDGDETRRLIIENDPPEATSLVIFSALYQNLEFLCLRGLIGCHNIVPSIDERGLNELTCLDVHDCEDLECIMEASKSPHGKSLSRLAELSMWDLPELKWIWKAPAQHVISLQTLTKLNVHSCNKLTYIFTLSQARSLEQLKSLYVSGCERLEYIVEAKFDHNEGEISVGDGNTMLALPLLRKLTLDDLPELTSFCSENYCSIWPALEELRLHYCPNLTVNSTELEANLQYLEKKLRILNVESCSHLSDTIPALLKHGLKNLEYLRIRQLRVQVVFQLEAIIAEGQENKLFPCLKGLSLRDLRELQVLLYHVGPTHNFSLQSLTYLRVDGCNMLRRLFSSTLARNLLQLEKLEIQDCLELEQIIDEDEDEDHLQPVCFPKLTVISVGYCPKLKHLFHISVAPSLQKLKYLWIIANDELEEVFWHKDGADVTDYNEIVMNELRDLKLFGLPNLTNFWPAGYQIPFPSASNEDVLNCPKLRGNSEGDDESKNSGAQAQQTTDEEMPMKTPAKKKMVANINDFKKFQKSKKKKKASFNLFSSRKELKL